MVKVRYRAFLSKTGNFLVRSEAEAPVRSENSSSSKSIPESLSGASAAALPDTTRTTGRKPESATSGSPGARVRNRTCSSTTRRPEERSASATTRRASSFGTRPSSATGFHLTTYVPLVVGFLLPIPCSYTDHRWRG